MDLKRFVVVMACAVAVTAAGINAQVNYVVGPQDVLVISVIEQADLTNKYVVEADGTFSFPFIGRVKAGGLTLPQIEELLTKRLADGYFRKPQVTVAVESYKSQNVLVLGEVRSPGSYSITGEMTLLEALAKAGGITADAGGDVTILRRKTVQPGAAIVPAGDEATELIRIDLKELQSGRPSKNLPLQDNDTINVPKNQLVYVDGQVRSPGAYPFQKGATVRQALTLAGGASDRAATSRIKVMRLVNGERREEPAKLDDPVFADDTIYVPERFF